MPRRLIAALPVRGKIYVVTRTAGAGRWCSVGDFRVCAVALAVLQIRDSLPRSLISPMATEPEPSPDDASPELDSAPPHRRRHRRWPWVLAAVIVLPIAIVALWTVTALHYSYSDGHRAGYVQKF